MALTDFFRINLPYGIRGNNTKGWFAFNREYKPVGFNMQLGRVDYDDYPIYTEYYLLTEKKLKLLNDDKEPIKEGDEFLIFLYDDGTNPMRSKGKLWDIYFAKLKILSKLRMKKNEF